MKEELSFEQSISQLETIVENLEGGNLTLDESIEMFQRGIELSNICSKKLDNAERKITMLIKTKQGEFKEEPFLQDEEE